MSIAVNPSGQHAYVANFNNHIPEHTIASDGIKICEILQRQGLHAAEVTFRTAAAETIIKQASKKYPDLLLGAGTILNTEDLQRAFKAGAEFGVAPGFNPTVVKEAVKLGNLFSRGL